jgi:ketosteroid isomerase-like protein
MLGEEPVRQGNVGVVRRLFEAFECRAEDALLDLVDPAIEFFGPTATVMHEGRCYRGHEGMRRYMRDVEVLWEELELEPERMHEVGNHVVVMGRVRARARDGLALDIPAAWVWRVEHGLVTWGCAYGDPEQMPHSLQEGARGPGTFDPTRLSAPDPTASVQEPPVR